MQLSLALLGPYEATLDGRSITGLYSSKVRALLAYLAVEAGRPHTRAMLAALLWPEWSDAAALGNLRFSLSKLRRALHDQDAVPPFLLISRDTIQLNPAADCLVDASSFESHVAAGQWQQPDADRPDEAAMRRAVGHLEAAAGLYRGPFLEGFTVGDSTTFEEWALLTRETIEQRMFSALNGLAALHYHLGEYAAAEHYCRRLLAMDPWDETANARLMSALAAAGQRNAALRHYAGYRAELAQALGAEPAAETTALYEQLRLGGEQKELPRPRPVAGPPPPGSRTSLLAREPELARLHGYLDDALAGRGCIAFVSGEAGSGKTALMSELARQAMARHPGLLVAVGRCSAYTGIGDPFLPFREIAQMLVSDVDARCASGEVSSEHARRLKSALAMTATALLEAGPDLVDRFVGSATLAHVIDAASAAGLHALSRAWQARIEEHRRLAARVEETDLFGQFTSFILAVAARHPLMLILDDLQWADNGSLSLLFHLGRRLAGARVLITGAYRPEELLPAPDGIRHPLPAAINELRRMHGDVEVDLDRADGRQFVEALIDREPNRLDAAFRGTLFQRTGGHPLFTVELLRSLRDAGALARDGAGSWVATSELDWSRLPPRVEAAIAQRIERLPQDWRSTLAAASIEGEEFTAEVVAQALGLDRAEALRRLSGPLSKDHRLVHGSGVARLAGGGQGLSRYRFQHALVQEYLYGRLDPVERAHLHGLVAAALEEIYGKQAPEIAVRLAWHFERAGLVTKAVDYLIESGNQAMFLGAYRQAAADFDRGRALLSTLPETPERAEREARLNPGLGLMLEANTCCEQGDFQRAIELGRQMLALAAANGDRRGAMLAHFGLGSTEVFSGDIAEARAELEAALALYRDPEDRALTAFTGADVRAVALGMLATVAWLLGYPDRAAAHGREAVKVAEESGQFETLATVVTNLVWLTMHSRSRTDLQPQIERLLTQAGETNAAGARRLSMLYSGWLLAQAGQGGEAADRIRRVLAGWDRMPGRTAIRVTLVQVCLQSGMYAEARQELERALAILETGIGRFFEAEFYRLQGALSAAQAPDDAGIPEEYYRKAIDTARGQQARVWELRASTDLARLYRRQGKVSEARELLSGIYGSFTEGFDTPDLVEARALLGELDESASVRKPQAQAPAA